MKRLIYLAIAVMVFASCATSKNVAQTQGVEYSAEDVEVVGYGRGVSVDWNTARGIAITNALGDLSTKMKAAVRTASSNYQKQSGTYNKTLFEAVTDVVSENHLEGVVYKGDKRERSCRGGQFEFRVEARIDHTILKKNIESILDELDATDEERDAFRREMFGNSSL
jgi:hypothetical protein